MSSVGFDSRFFISRDGIFKELQFILSLVILIIVSASDYGLLSNFREAYFTSFTAGFASVTLLISIIIYSFKLYRIPLVKKLPWKLMEIIFNASLAVLYFISMAVCGSVSAKTVNCTNCGDLYNVFFAAAILCAVTMVAFLGHVLLIVRSGTVRSQEAPHQEAAVNT